MHRIPYALERLDTPVIAAVNGAAVGAGMDMALMCDMRFAGRSARFSEGYIRAGLIPGDGACYFLPRLVGLAKALELLLSADFVDAAEALRIGIVNRVYDDDVLLAETLAFAGRLAHSPPVHLRLIKRNVYQSYQNDLHSALELAASHMGIVRTLEDSKEAVTALLERRPGELHRPLSGPGPAEGRPDQPAAVRSAGTRPPRCRPGGARTRRRPPARRPVRRRPPRPASVMIRGPSSSSTTAHR